MSAMVPTSPDHILEFPRSNAGLCADILNSVVCARRVHFGGDAEHALKGIDEKHADKAE